MKISKLINQLAEAKKIVGDLDVSLCDSIKGITLDFELGDGAYMRVHNPRIDKWETINTICFSVPKIGRDKEWKGIVGEEK